MSVAGTFESSVWPLLARLGGPGQGAALESRVLFAGRPRALLVPARDARGAHAAVSFFVSSPLRRLMGHAMLLADRWLPLNLLPRVRWEGFPARALFGGAAREGACAVLCGSPGPLQKVTVLHPPQGDAPARVAKVALRASADAAVAVEERWLRQLNAAPVLAPYVPRLTAAGELAGGRRYVAMDALDGEDAAPVFGEAQRRFLAALAATGCVKLPWAQAPSMRTLLERVRGQAGLYGRWRDVIEASLAEVEGRIGGMVLPACLAHGDFAPWNLRVDGERLRVFDWEYAHAGASPLHDFFHFHLVPEVLRGRELDVAALCSLLPRAAAHGRAVFGAASGVDQAAPALAAQYLLEVVTFYTAADRELKAEHPVLRVYLELLARRGLWMGWADEMKEAA